MQNNRRHRGTVIMLAVAVLALLAVMGTAYLLMSRVDRGTTRAVSDTVNLDFARDSVLDDARRAMINTVSRPADGAMLVSMTSEIQPWRAGVNYAVNSLVLGKDGQIYRCILASNPSSTTVDADGPPPGANATINTKWVLLQVWSNSTAYTTTSVVIAPDMRIYRCTTGHSSPAVPGTFSASPNWTLIGESITRNYDYPEANSNWANMGRSSSTPGVADQTWLARGLVPVSASDLSTLFNGRFNTSTGTYNLTWVASPGTNGPPTNTAPTTAIANTNDPRVIDPVSTSPDGNWQLLPFSTASGIRFRYSLRILDTSRFINLNTGSVDSSLSAADTTGLFLTTPFLGQSTIYQGGAADVLANIQSANSNGLRGRGPTVTFSLIDWQNRVLGYERYGLNSGVVTPDAEWFDLTDELDFRSYGLKGAGYNARAAAASSPNILGTTLAPNSAGRNFYTTYSFDRNANNLGVTFTPAFTLTIGTATVSVPAAGRDVHLGASTTTADQAARNAIYLANLLARVGYNTDEALSFALNYLAQTAPAYRTSCITPNGLTISNGTGGATSTYALTPATTKKYLAYSAQPFINELAVSALDTSTGTPPYYDDFAVELVNPHAGAIDLTGWKLKVNGNDWINDVGALMGGPIAANGFVVFKTGTTIPGVAGTPVTAPALPVDPGNTVVVVTLERPYWDTAQQYMIVDKHSSAASTWPVARTGAAVVYSSQKPNTRFGGVADLWAVTSPTTYGASTLAHTLGSANSATIIGENERRGIALTDRYAVATPPGPAGEIARSNMGDLQDYMRMTTVDNAGTVTTIAEQLSQTAAPVFKTTTTGSAFPQEARVRLDYLADARASQLLFYFTQVDRASDGVDQLGVGSADTLNEVRIPGRINVNTASADVLRTIPFLTDIHVAHIVAYRDRAVVAAYGSYTPAAMPNFNNALPTYVGGPFATGRGIRSFAELLIPIAMAEGRIQTLTSPNRLGVVSTETMNSLYGPGSTWAKLFTVATVRSDTFVVYGYIEAIRGHPRDTGGASNTSWYTGTVSDDAATTATLQRVARRRFVAIVDRSWCNIPRGQTGFVLPRVVAVKDLPQ